MKEDEQLLLDEVRQTYASVVWTHKIQEKQADIYANKYNRFEFCNIILAGITSCGLVSIIFCSDFVIKLVTAFVSFLSFVSSAYLKSYNLRNLEQQHRIAANNFIIIRNRLLHIITELHMGKELLLIEKEYDDIRTDLNELFKNAPSTTEKAVEKANKALKVKNEYTYSNEEIDCFLPNSLKGGIK